jgi:hypothetical protein
VLNKPRVVDKQRVQEVCVYRHSCLFFEFSDDLVGEIIVGYRGLGGLDRLCPVFLEQKVSG